MKKVCMLAFIMVLVVSSFAVAQDNYISKIAISEKETQIATVLDNIYILPTTKTIVIRVMRVYLDNADKVLRSESAGQIIYKDEVDNPETEQNEEITAYTDFLASAGIDIDAIRDALK